VPARHADWDVTALTERGRTLAGGSARTLLGITGPPGAGKSTLADALAAGLADLRAVVVPMDGFHLSNRVLAAQGLRDVKGAIQTFDGSGFVSLLERLRTHRETVYAPGFPRELDEPVAAQVVVPGDCRLVVVEGNYLLADRPPWQRVRGLLDEIWYVDLPDRVRIPRLVRRHERHGRSRAEAQDWVRTTDEPNADLIRQTRGLADLIIGLPPV
jgi:pantothenate kinase